MTPYVMHESLKRPAPSRRSKEVGFARINPRSCAHSDASDHELLAAARDSDSCAFAELCSRHADSIQKRVFRILRNHEDTEDALQEAMYKAFLHLNHFEGRCAFSSWLTRIAINSAFMTLRKRKLRSEVSYESPVGQDGTRETWEFPDRSPNAEQVCIWQQTLECLAIAVKRLPSRDRELIREFHGAERSLSETAEKLGLRVNTAKSRLVRARQRMRTTLRSHGIALGDPWR